MRGENIHETPLIFRYNSRNRFTSPADIERAKATFRRIVGIGPGEDVTVAWNKAYIDFTFLSDYKKAVQNRPEFKAFDAAIEASASSAQGAHAGVFPTVTWKNVSRFTTLPQLRQL